MKLHCYECCNACGEFCSYSESALLRLNKNDLSHKVNYVASYPTYTQGQNINYTLYGLISNQHAVMNLEHYARVNTTVDNDARGEVLADSAGALIMIQDTYRFSLDHFPIGRLTSNINFLNIELPGRYKFSFDRLHFEDMFYLSHIAFKSTLYDMSLKFLSSAIAMHTESKCLSAWQKGYCIEYNFLPTMEHYIMVHNNYIVAI